MQSADWFRHACKLQPCSWPLIKAFLQGETENCFYLFSFGVSEMFSRPLNLQTNRWKKLVWAWFVFLIKVTGEQLQMQKVKTLVWSTVSRWSKLRRSWRYLLVFYCGNCFSSNTLCDVLCCNFQPRPHRCKSWQKYRQL